MTLPLASALIREVDIRGVFRYVNEYEFGKFSFAVNFLMS